jgi:hypothetical protein
MNCAWRGRIPPEIHVLNKKTESRFGLLCFCGSHRVSPSAVLAQTRLVGSVRGGALDYLPCSGLLFLLATAARSSCQNHGPAKAEGLMRSRGVHPKGQPRTDRTTSQSREGSDHMNPLHPLPVRAFVSASSRSSMGYECRPTITVLARKIIMYEVWSGGTCV